MTKLKKQDKGQQQPVKIARRHAFIKKDNKDNEVKGDTIQTQDVSLEDDAKKKVKLLRNNAIIRPRNDAQTDLSNITTRITRSKAFRGGLNNVKPVKQPRECAKRRASQKPSLPTIVESPNKKEGKILNNAQASCLAGDKQKVV